ncbi:MAG: hypothetical protein M3083_12705 [Actinomycetota bacterium]|nr:hypothetical protein [Actinomycetota bacterium]
MLSSSGHIAGIVNPPGGKARHWVNQELPATPDEWLAGATCHNETWWQDWADWVEPRAGKRKRQPPPMGSPRHPPVADAPGRYVLEK